MPSTYTLNNGIELIGTGEQSGTWGDTTNLNLELLDTALDGQVTVTLASAGTSGSPNTLPISDGAASDGRNRMVIFDDSSDLGATAYVQLTPNDAEKIIYIRNSLSGGRDIIMFQGTYSASNDYLVPNGTTAVIYFDGAGAGAVAANVLNTLQVDALNVESDAATTAITIDNTATDGDPILGFALSGTNTFTMGVDDGDSDKFKIGTSAIGTDTRLTITSSGAVGIGEDSPDVLFHIKSANSGGVMTIESTNASSSSGPNLNLLRTSASPADDDNIGKINFQAYDDGSNNTVYASIQTLIRDTTDTTEDGRMLLNTILNGALVSRVELDSDETVINENSYDLDFRVESNNFASMFFVDATNDRVGVGVGSPSVTLEVLDPTSSNFNGAIHVGGNGSNRRLVLEQSDATTYKIGGTGSSSITQLVSGGTAGVGNIRTTIDADGNLSHNKGAVFNDVGGDNDFRIESDLSEYAFFLDAGNNVIGTGTSTPATYVDSGGFAIKGATASDLALVSTSVSSGSNSHQLKFYNEAGASYEIARMRVNVGTGQVNRGEFQFSVNNGGGMRPFLDVNYAGDVVFNNQGYDSDFRVGTDTNTHAFVVDSTTNSTSIGGNIPNSTYKLNVSSAQRIVGDTARLFVQGTNTGSGSHVSYIDVQTLAERGSHIALIDDDGVEFGIKRDYASGSPITRAILYADDGTTQRRILDWGKAGNYAVFNEEGNDMDFRVESDGATHMLFVDASANAIGINSSNPDSGRYLHIEGGGTGVGITLKDTGSPGTQYGIYSEGSSLYFQNDSASSYPLIILNSGDLRTLGDNSTAQELQFRTSSTAGRKVIKSLSRTDSGSTNPMVQMDMLGYGSNGYLGQMNMHMTNSDIYNSAQIDVFSVYSTSGAIFNDDSTSYNDFRVESDTQTHMLFVDAGNNQVGIGTSTPNAILGVSGSSGDVLFKTPAYEIIAFGATGPGSGVTRTYDLLEFTSDNQVLEGTFEIMSYRSGFNQQRCYARYAISAYRYSGNMYSTIWQLDNNLVGFSQVEIIKTAGTPTGSLIQLQLTGSTSASGGSVKCVFHAFARSASIVYDGTYTDT